MEKLIKNSSATLRIEGYTSEGMGIGHIDTMAVFVKGAVNGELCRVKLVKIGKTVAYGRLEEIIEASPSRTKPLCPYFGSCGGCDFWHISYEEELKLKQKRVQDALIRIGGLDLEVSGIIGSNEIEGYRNKVSYPVGLNNGLAVMGYYRSRSHDIIPVSRCLICSENMDNAAAAVRRWMEKYKIPAYDEAHESGLVRHVYIRTGGERLIICVVINGDSVPEKNALVDEILKSCPETDGIILNINKASVNRILGEKTKLLWGRDYLESSLRGLSFRLSPHSFYQINSPQAERLYALVEEFACAEKSDTVLDMYCGIGTITLAMARHAGKVIGIESVAQAVDDARENALRNGISNAAFICGDAASAELTASPDILIVDPPRKGLSPQAVEAVVKLSPRRMVYVSCDPATLARDLKLLNSGGLQPVKAIAVDMFPRTAHVESIILMTKCGQTDK